MSVKALRIDVRDDLVIVRMVGESIAPLAGVVIDSLLGGVIDVAVDMLAELGIVIVVAPVIVLEVFMAVPTRVSLLEDSLRSRSAARSCWRMAAVGCLRALQAWMPSYHVCTTFALPAPPQVPNQEPPRPQQLFLTDLRMVPHWAQTELMAFVVTAEWLYMGHSQTRTDTNVM